MLTVQLRNQSHIYNIKTRSCAILTWFSKKKKKIYCSNHPGALSNTLANPYSTVASLQFPFYNSSLGFDEEMTTNHHGSHIVHSKMVPEIICKLYEGNRVEMVAYCKK